MSTFQVILYKEDYYEEITRMGESRIIEDHPDKVFWGNVNLHGDQEQLQKVFERIHAHPMVQRGILDKTKRPRIQDFEEAILLQVYSVNKDESGEFELLKFILGPKFVISFQEKDGDPFDGVRKRLQDNKGIIRSKGADFLLFRLLEAIIEGYFDLVEDLQGLDFFSKSRLGDWNPDPASMKSMENLNQRLFEIKKSIRPLIETVAFLEKGLSGLIHKKNAKYYHDLRQQCQFLIDSIESFEHRLESSINLFFTMQGHRQNQVMKTLTVVSSIFIPLTFLAGIYGMNFEYMPELDDKYSYFIVLGIMFSIAVGMTIFLKMRKWF